MELTFRPQLAGDETAARTLLNSPQSPDRANGADLNGASGKGAGCHMAANTRAVNGSPLARNTNVYVGFVDEKMVGAAVIERQ